jgi:LacI family transcriptional regulator
VVFGVIRGAERAAAAAGYSLIIAESQQSGSPEADAARTLVRSVDGFVLAMTWLDDEEIQRLAAHKPLALVNRAVEGVPSAYPDVTPGIEQLLDHLQERGHRVIGFLSGPERSWMNGQRWRAIFEGARARGLSVFDIPGGEATIESGRAAVDRIVASPATALVAYNDLMAIGVLQGCRERGIRVPEDLAITGFDAIFGSELTTPALTTVATPLERIAARAVELLVGAPVDDSPLETTLVVRASS